MKFSLHSKTDASTPTIIIHHAAESPDKTLLGKTKYELLNLHLKKKSFEGEKDQQLTTHITTGRNAQNIMLYGGGKSKEMNDKTARELGAKLIKSAQNWEEPTISIIVSETLQQHLQAFSEGLVMGQFNPAIYKTGEEEKKLAKKRIKNVHLIASSWKKNQEEAIEKGSAIAEVVNYTRNIVNCGPNELDTDQLVNEIKEVAKENRYKITDMTKKQLEKLKMGGILAVNRGSEQPAHMMILEHEGSKKEDPIVIAGKGIIFDTGGISLKPSTHMSEMQLDMAGAAVVLGVFKLLKKLKIDRHIIGIIPITDNAINNNAYRPSEIITTYSGKTVEIMNTDAEGRMILCDALAYSAEKFSPKYLIDFATLTGACMVALGFRTAGLFGNDEKLIQQLDQAGKRSDESLCHLPITDSDEQAMKGKLADLTNLAGDHSYAGASRAAAFLQNFVGKSKWAHVDIAGPSFTKTPKAYESSMATGFGIRMMIDFLENLD